MDTKACDVVISGGGLVGMSMAAALGRAGLRVAVVDKTVMEAQLDCSFDGRVSAVSYGSKCILDGIGAWQAMAPEAEPILDIRVSDGGMPFFLHYGHEEVGAETNDSPLGYIVENRHIRFALQQAVTLLDSVTYYGKCTITMLERDDAGVTLAISNGERLRCRLLIVAEGRQSPTRDMAGIGVTQWQYGQTAIVCTIAHEKPHHGLAQERFLPAGPFAVLPMTPLRQGYGGQASNRSSLVWVEPEDRVSLYMELDEAECVQEIQERVGDYLGQIRLAGPRFTYPLSLMHAKNYTSHRVALIGDSAHAIHPIAGQGVNLGFRDVAVLAELIIDKFKLGLDIGDKNMLRDYQRWRRFDNVTMLAVTDWLNRLFCMNSLPVQLARGLGLWTVGRFPPLKRFLMRHAMGLVGDLPKIVTENR